MVIQLTYQNLNPKNPVADQEYFIDTESETKTNARSNGKVGGTNDDFVDYHDMSAKSVCNNLKLLFFNDDIFTYVTKFAT